MARATIRYSFDNEQSNLSGNKARGALEEAGFSRNGTASWEAYGSITDLVDAIRNLLTVVEAPPGRGGLDHVWIYLDGVADDD